MEEALRGCIITTVISPPGLKFEEFYNYLFERGYVIYPGKTAAVDSFRVGTIGAINPSDVADLVAAVKLAFKAQGIATPVVMPSTVSGSSVDGQRLQTIASAQ